MAYEFSIAQVSASLTDLLVIGVNCSANNNVNFMTCLNSYCDKLTG
jgi:hypothetical protein